MQLNFYENIHNTLQQNPEQVYIVWPALAGEQPEPGKLSPGKEKIEGEDPLPAKSYTGREILCAVAACRSLFQKNRIAKGDEVLLAMPLGFELICALLALMAHGAIPVLPPAGAGPLQMLRLLRKRPLKAIIVAGKPKFFISLLLKSLGIKPIKIQPADCQPGLAGTRKAVVLVEEAQAALISHSSGSTGNAKAIFRSHHVLLAQHRALKETFPPFAGQHDFPLFPNVLLHNLSLGIRSILPALPGFELLKIKPACLLAQLKREHVHTLSGNVFYFKNILACLQQQAAVYREVKALGIGGSPVPEALLFGLKDYFPEATIYVIYGSTEAEPIAVRAIEGQPLDPAAGYGVGKFIPSLQWRLRPYGMIKVKGMEKEVGEIEVKGPHVVLKEGAEWLQTGDFGYIDNQRNLFLSGRRGNEPIHAGLQHYQLEHFLLQLEGVERAAALSREKCFDIYVQGKDVELKKVEEKLKEAFSEEAIGRLFVREYIPVDARHHSKILYGKLR